MILFKKAADLRKWLDAQPVSAGTTGFIPTMGALHNGHISLIETAKKENSFVICSIFVNPAQFNDQADFKKYPVTIEKDIYLLEKAGCDILFLPSVKEIYPDGIFTGEHYELGYLETVLEGKYRPGHFQGVCMVVHRLLEIVKPGRLYLGQKDYQQCLVITRLIELINMTRKMNIIICPTLREKDGLAMSSRNQRLNEEERKKAPAIYKSLSFIKENVGKIPPNKLKKEAGDMLTKNGFKVDYVEIADAATLKPANDWTGEQKLIGLAAAFNNEIRLIDNIQLN